MYRRHLYCFQCPVVFVGLKRWTSVFSSLRKKLRYQSVGMPVPQPMFCLEQAHQLHVFKLTGLI